MTKDSYLLLLLDNQLRIKNIVGDEKRFFHYAIPRDELKQIFLEHMSTTKDRIKKKDQVFYTRHGEKVFYFYEPISDAGEHAVVMIKPHVKKTVLAQDVDTEMGRYLIMDSPPMQRIRKIIDAISTVDSTVLLLGESGVGKSAIANYIHQVSNRSEQPFISVNCGALPENLIDTELFGYEHGSFTGGKKGGKKGMFEIADQGTLFLDEIAEIPLNLQSKLLGVLQDNVIRKVGGTDFTKVNVRLIAATNKDLVQLVKEKKFREDLYYRLNVVPLVIPALRERKEDLPKLIDYFLAKYNRKYDLSRKLTQDKQEQLMHYHWPGNIRELENTIERTVVANIGYEWEEEILPSTTSTDKQSTTSLMPLKKAKKMVEKELITKAYELYGSTYKAAKVLKVDQSTVSKKLKEYRLTQHEGGRV